MKRLAWDWEQRLRSMGREMLPRDRRSSRRLSLEWLESRLAPAAHDTIGTALSVSLVSQAHDTRTLETANTVDLYAVTLKAGEAILAEALTPQPGSLKPALRIFDDSGTPLTPLDALTGANPELSYAAPTDGMYFVGVSSVGNLGYDPTTADSGNGGISSGVFTLDLTRLAAATEREPRGMTGGNETPQTAEALTTNTSLSGNLPSGDVDTYRFTMLDSGRFRGMLTARDANVLNTRMRLLDASGQLLIQSDGRSPEDPTSVLDQHLQAGTYLLELSAYRNSSDGGDDHGYELTTRIDDTLPPFTPLSVDPNPVDVVVRDVNRDGRPDVITANRLVDDVSVLLGNGDGTFEKQQFFDVGTNPVSVAVEDLNRDGLLDIVTANEGDGTATHPGGASVLLGNGDGTFQSAQSYDAGKTTESIVIEDINGDGLPDIITANFGSNNVSVLLQNVDGTFGKPIFFAVGKTPNCVAVGDIDGDGLPDLVTANRNDNSLSVLLGDGHGTFANPITVAVKTAPVFVTVADVSGDGLLDLITANTTSNDVIVLLRNADGSFRQARSFAVGKHPESVAVADVNGDGRLDLVTANLFSSDASVLLGNGDGTFQPTRSYSVGTSPFTVVVQDINGDGHPDLVTANRFSNDVSVLLGNGDGTFEQKQSLNAATGPDSVAVRDINGDGHPDIVTANRFSNDVSFQLGNGDGTFQKAQSFAAGIRPDSVAIEDINEDGRLDLVVADAGSNAVSVLLGNGNGTFRSAQSFHVGSEPTFVSVQDVNGDGHFDIVTANFFSNDVSLLVGNGDGTFRKAKAIGAGTHPFKVAVRDINGDGRPDIVTSNDGSNDVSVLLQNSDGTFQKAKSLLVGTRPQAVAVQDLDGDGRPDIVTSNYGSKNVSVLLQDPDGTFQKAAAFAVGTTPSSLAIRDVNGDGVPDIVTANVSDNDVSVLFGIGDGSFQDAQAFAVGQRPFGVTIHDVNGDGQADIITANFGSNDVTVLLGNADGGVLKTRTYPVGTSPQSLTVGDVNGDGLSDLVTANRDDNNVSVLLGKSDGSFQAAASFSVGKSPYSVEVHDVNGDGRPDIVTANLVDDTVSVLFQNADGTFQNVTTFRVGTSPFSVKVGDIDNDGLPDIVTANRDSNDVSVLFQNADGMFRQAKSLPVGTKPESVTVQDLNKDGLPDIVTANFDSNDASVLLQNADGTFPKAMRFAAGSGPQSVAVSDLNGDGLPDLAVANFGSYDVSVLLGKGDGTFQSANSFEVGVKPYSVVVQDINGDGLPDLVTANSDSNNVSVLVGNGDGTFQPAQNFPTGTTPYSVAVQDVNGDGRPDIITANFGSNDVSVLQIPIENAFEPPRNPANIPTHDVPVLADINGDGIPDALSLNSSGEILFRQGTNDPRHPFAPFVVVDPGQPAKDFTVLRTAGLPDIAALDSNGNAVSLSTWSPKLHRFARGGTIATGNNPVRIAGADLNGDGFGDLVIGNSLDHSVTIAFQLADGRFDSHTLTRLVGDQPSSITFANLSGFGNDIVVSGQVSGDVTLLYNDASHSFDTQSRYRAGLGLFDTISKATGTTIRSNQQTVGAIVADIGNAGRDIVTLNRLTNTFTVLHNRGDGAFIDPQSGDVHAIGAPPVQVIAGDFLHNGQQDLAVLTTGEDGTSRVMVYLREPDGTVADAIANPAGQGATGFSFIPATAHTPDRFLVGNTYGDFLTLVGDKTGHFVVERGSLDGKPLAVGKTSDGRQFAVVADQSEDRVQVYFRKPGTNQFGTPTTYDSTAGKTLLAPGAVQLIDLNKDGNPDLVVASRLGNDILVYPGLADGTFGVPTSFAVGFEPVSFTAADLNGDGVPDLAVVNQGSNDVSVLDGTIDPKTHLWTATPGPRLSSGGSEPVAVVAGTFNGDAIPDLRVTNRGGQVFTMAGIGSSGTGTGFFQDASGQTRTLGSTITGEVFDPTTNREFVVSGGQIFAFDGTAFTALNTPGFITTLGIADGFLVAGFADRSVGVLSEEDGSLLKQSFAFADTPSALQALQNGDHIDIFLTLQGSQVPVFVSLLIPVVTQLTDSAAVAQATSLPGAELVLVATLLTGGLDEGTSRPAEVVDSEATFVLFLPPVKVRVAEQLGAEAEEVVVTPIVKVNAIGEAPSAEFQERVREALADRLMSQQVFDTLEDLVEAIQGVLERFQSKPAPEVPMEEVLWGPGFVEEVSSSGVGMTKGAAHEVSGVTQQIEEVKPLTSCAAPSHLMASLLAAWACHAPKSESSSPSRPRRIPRLGTRYHD